MFQSEEEQEKEKTFPEKQDINVKMTFQYPERKTFRFPVIPDDGPNEKKLDEDTPAYLRRNSESIHRKVTRNQRGEDPDSKKVYKSEDAPRFKATRVPSPIYGYERRPSKVEEVPAYVRRREQQEENGITETVENFKPIEEVEESATMIDTSLVEEDFRKTEEENKSPLQENNIIEKSQQSSEQVKKRSNERRRMRKNKKDRSGRVNNRKPTNVPYNVLMTPMDQKKWRARQSTEAIKEKQEVEEIKPTNENSQKDTLIPLYLLNDVDRRSHAHDHWMQEQQRLLEQTLKHFHVAAKVVKATQGPTVTRFEVQPELGVKVSKIRNLSDDLKLNMSAKDIRIEAPIPGKNTVGIEVPNPEPQMVGLQEILESPEFQNSKSPLSIALGLTIEGKPKVTNIQKMPHGLIAGATGSGKSVCINSILLSILYKASHEDVKFLLIDPKMVELAPYNGIPHLVAPVITDVKAATQSLKWAVAEMEDRYERFVEEGVRDIERFNRKVIGQGRKEDKMPYIVIVIDELADLMMISPQDVETSISRIAQKARACGIHLLLATQRPSVDVITGLIKANIPTRIAFSVSSQVDSRTILDSSGAEKLLGKGDMLFMENGTGKSVRLQGPFVSDEEIERVISFARDIAEPNYLFEQKQLLQMVQEEEDEDELLHDAIEFVVQQQSASTSMLQRHFKIGYNRAARLIDTMEARGIISGQNGSKPRDVLITEIDVE